MLIVTQVGFIVNFDRMEQIFIEGDDADLNTKCRIIALGGSGKYVTLGWYKNQRRAEDVMQEIVKAHNITIVYRMPEM